MDYYNYDISEMHLELSISELREKLKGIEEGSIVLLNFNSLDYSDLTFEALDFMINEKGAGITYITASRPYNYLASILENKKIDKENLFFIDCITHMANIMPEKNEKCVFIENPASLEEMGMHTERLLGQLKTENKFLFIDSLSTLLMYNNTNSLKEFSHFLTTRLRINGIGGIFVAIKGLSDEDVIETIAMMCDKVIEI
ncbi:hypothetical protein BEH94_10025 [Candidatus Altiarchaeales archaeon WOR_SM1_SCG]|nr:hypothetical protein BEH94_10025 [Candidatus Altiarchaeales archaeon WOR_SM1_SCG]